VSNGSPERTHGFASEFAQHTRQRKLAGRSSSLGQSSVRPSGVEVSFATGPDFPHRVRGLKSGPVVVKRNPLEGEKTVGSQDLKTNTQNTPRIIFRSDVLEEKGQNGPTSAEIRQRAFEIHLERGGVHGCELDDWLQAERELQEKYNKNNDGETKKK
jgi:Protein of unknown function (DUF2934)